MRRRLLNKIRLFVVCVAIVIFFYLLHSDVPVVKEDSINSKKSKAPDNKLNKAAFATNKIKVVSQNIYLPVLPWLGNNHDVSNRLQAFAEDVSPCDIVIIQEIFIFRAGPWTRLHNFVELGMFMLDKGFLYRASSVETIPQFFGQNSGLAIYSKHPLLHSRTGYFEDRSLGEKTNNKGYIIAKISTGRRIIYVVNTHLDARDRFVRQKQLNKVMQAVRSEIKKAPGLIILAGDLNTEWGEEEIDVVKKKMQMFGLKEVFGEHLETSSEGTTLDHMFVSKRLTVQKKSIRKFVTVNKEPVSDHYALWAELNL